MMTEEEARNKWCFAARDSNTAGNRSSIAKFENNDYRCIASQCMAWRVRQAGALGDQSAPLGYCGLAGKP